MKRQGVLSLTGVALLGLIVMMTLHEWDYATPPPPPVRPDTPTMVLEQMHATSHDADGQLQYNISADDLTYFEVSDRSTLTQPHLEMFGKKARWLVTAKQGEMQQTQKIIDLRGDVSAEREGDQPLSLKTEHLIYHADQQTLVIPAAVDITHEGGHTHAGQLEADMKQGIITMKGGVETRYVPTAG